jgi:hypothetical protein
MPSQHPKPLTRRKRTVCTRTVVGRFHRLRATRQVRYYFDSYLSPWFAAVTWQEPFFFQEIAKVSLMKPCYIHYKRKHRARGLAAGALAALLALAACTEAPSWQKLLAAKITQQYPAYTVQPTPDGNLKVERPGLATVPVDVDTIARFCQRGPQDCNYATDQMLLALQKQ